MVDEGTLVISGIILIVTLAGLAVTMLRLSKKIDDVERKLMLELRIELEKSELKHKYLNKTYDIEGNEYTVTDVVLSDLQILSGLVHLDYLIEMMGINGYITTINHKQFEDIIEERDDDRTDKGTEQCCKD